jgi:hypothetical protein
MKVLLLEHGTTAETAVESRLEEAGHDVVRCHEPDRPAFPCRGLLDEGHCPLDGQSVSVAVDVSPAPEEYPEHNDGVTCALRHDVPVVLTGEVPDESIAALASAFAAPRDVAAAVELAAQAPLRHPSEAATFALRDTLGRHGLAEVMATAEVRRDGSCLSVTLDVDAPLTAAVKQAAAVRVLAAVRALHPHASKVGVGFRRRPEATD